jgi:hypothetical protein
MANVVGKLGYKLVSVGVGIPVGIATRKLVQRVWIAARPDDPPRKPTDPEVSWSDAMGWAALSAAGVAVAELVTMKGASSVWRAVTGREPPVKKPKHEEPAKDAKAVSVAT